MIQFKPFIGSDIVCPECGAASAVEGTEIAGMNIYARCTCTRCGMSFFQMLPVGHFINEPVAFAPEHHRVFHKNQEYQWLASLVANSFPLQKQKVAITKKVFRTTENVILLDALDYLYGHSLLKLYNAQLHLDNSKDLGLIIMLPAALEWMLPHGTAEAWIVDLTLNELKRGYEAIRDFADRELKRFNQVYLSPAHSHPDFGRIDIHRFTGISPFDLRDFYRRQPRITFVLREDRWWFGHRTEYWFYRLCRKFGMMKFCKGLLAMRQVARVQRTIAVIKRAYPAAEFYIAGIGRTGSFNGFAKDLRVLKPGIDTEKEWCGTYAGSHVVIGFHGSNMLLPTAFAAGCVEILPEDRYGNIVQDLSVRYSDRRQLFFYRFADQYIKPASLASKAVSIIRNFNHFYLNMCLSAGQT